MSTFTLKNQTLTSASSTPVTITLTGVTVGQLLHVAIRSETNTTPSLIAVSDIDGGTWTKLEVAATGYLSVGYCLSAPATTVRVVLTPTGTLTWQTDVSEIDETGSTWALAETASGTAYGSSYTVGTLTAAAPGIVIGAFGRATGGNFVVGPGFTLEDDGDSPNTRIGLEWATASSGTIVTSISANEAVNVSGIATLFTPTAAGGATIPAFTAAGTISVGGVFTLGYDAGGGTCSANSGSVTLAGNFTYGATRNALTIAGASTSSGLTGSLTLTGTATGLSGTVNYATGALVNSAGNSTASGAIAFVNNCTTQIATAVSATLSGAITTIYAAATAVDPAISTWVFQINSDTPEAFANGQTVSGLDASDVVRVMGYETSSSGTIIVNGSANPAIASGEGGTFSLPANGTVGTSITGTLTLNGSAGGSITLIQTHTAGTMTFTPSGFAFGSTGGTFTLTSPVIFEQNLDVQSTPDISITANSGTIDIRGNGTLTFAHGNTGQIGDAEPGTITLNGFYPGTLTLTDNLSIGVFSPTTLVNASRGTFTYTAAQDAPTGGTVGLTVSAASWPVGADPFLYGIAEVVVSLGIGLTRVTDAGDGTILVQFTSPIVLADCNIDHLYVVDPVEGTTTPTAGTQSTTTSLLLYSANWTAGTSGWAYQFENTGTAGDHFFVNLFPVNTDIDGTVASARSFIRNRARRGFSRSY